jgi:hypothetical protein
MFHFKITQLFSLDDITFSSQCVRIILICLSFIKSCLVITLVSQLLQSELINITLATMASEIVDRDDLQRVKKIWSVNCHLCFEAVTLIDWSNNHRNQCGLIHFELLDSLPSHNTKFCQKCQDGKLLLWSRKSPKIPRGEFICDESGIR